MRSDCWARAPRLFPHFLCARVHHTLFGSSCPPAACSSSSRTWARPLVAQRSGSCGSSGSWATRRCGRGVGLGACACLAPGLARPDALGPVSPAAFCAHACVQPKSSRFCAAWLSAALLSWQKALAENRLCVSCPPCPPPPPPGTCCVPHPLQIFGKENHLPGRQVPAPGAEGAGQHDACMRVRFCLDITLQKCLMTTQYYCVRTNMYIIVYRGVCGPLRAAGPWAIPVPVSDQFTPRLRDHRRRTGRRPVQCVALCGVSGVR